MNRLLGRRWLPDLRGTVAGFGGPAAMLLLSGAIPVSIALIAMALLLSARRDAGREADQNAWNIARAVGQDVAHTLELYDLSLRVVARQVQTPGLSELSPELRQSLLYDGAARDRRFGFINVLNEKGEVIADSASATPRVGNYAGRDYFIAQREDARDLPYVGLPFPFSTGAPTTIPISRRIFRADGAFGGVVVGTLRLNYLQGLFARVSVGAHGTIALLRADGVLLQQRPQSTGSIGRKEPEYAGFLFQGGDFEVSADLRSAADHRLRHVVFHSIQGWPLVVAVGLDHQEIYAAWYAEAAGISLMLFVLIALELVLLFRLRLAWAENGRKGWFLNTISHQIRGPLNGILAQAECLAAPDLAPEVARSIDHIRSEGEHLRNVVERVLDYARVSAAGAKPVAQPTNLGRTLEQCCIQVRSVARAKGLRVVSTLEPDLPSRIITDPTRLRCILGNLVENAAKYTETGCITVRASRAADALRLTVTDTGPGVPAALRGRLFRGTGRSCPHPARDDSNGIGLAMAGRFARELGGSIEHEDNPEGGSIFRVTLPLAPACPAIAEAQTGSQPPTSLRLLMVDDSDAQREPLALSLRRAGHDVIEARSGTEAVRLAEKYEFDAILMDLRMPGMGGLEATRLIRGLPGERGKIPVVALSAEPPEHRRQELRDAGIELFEGKPCDPRRLERVLAAIPRRSGGAFNAAPEAPRPAVPDQASLDPRVLEALESVQADPVQGHLQSLLDRIDGLTACVRVMTGNAHSGELSDLLHRIAGDAHQLGLTPLALACGTANARLRGDPPATVAWGPLIRAAEASRHALLQRLQGSRGGQDRSAVVSAQ